MRHANLTLEIQQDQRSIDRAPPPGGGRLRSGNARREQLLHAQCGADFDAHMRFSLATVAEPVAGVRRNSESVAGAGEHSSPAKSEADGASNDREALFLMWVEVGSWDVSARLQEEVELEQLAIGLRRIFSVDNAFAGGRVGDHARHGTPQSTCPTRIIGGFCSRRRGYRSVD